MKIPFHISQCSWHSTLTLGMLVATLIVGLSLSGIQTCQGACGISVGTSPEQSLVSGTGVFVPNAGSSTVSVIDTSRNLVEKTISVGSSPSYAAKSGTGIFVANGDGTVSVIDTTTLTVDKTITVGDSPDAIFASGSVVYVANRGENTVSVINATTNTVTATVSVGNGPYWLVRNGTGVFVANVDTNTVSVIDTTTNTVDRTITVGSTPTRLTSFGTGVYVPNANSNNVSIIDARRNTVAKTVSVGSYPSAANRTATGVFITNYDDQSVSVINTRNNTVIKTISVDNGPYSIDFSGTGAYVPNYFDNTVSVLDIVRLVNVSDIAVGDQPTYVSFYSTNAYVSNRNSNSITVISTATNAERSYCANAVCGDGLVDLPETCDDDNTSNSDGCSSSCTIESNWSCITPTIYSITRCVANAVCSPLVHYSLDNTSGDFVTVNGTFSASIDVPSVEPSGGTSLIFDGSSTSLVAYRPVQDDFTICAWFKTTSAGNGTDHWRSMAIVDSEVAFVANDFGFGVDSNGKLMFGNGGGYDTTARTSSAVNTGNWVHGCVTRVKSTGAIRLYVNGVFDGMGTGSTVTLSDDSYIIIGDGDDGGKKWNGKLDEIRFFGYALSPSEISSIYSGSCYLSGSSSSSSVSQAHTGGSRGKTGNTIILQALEGLSATRSSQPTLSSILPLTRTLLTTLEQRTCSRVRKWFASNPSVFERVNNRVIKRLGFSCK